MRADTFARRLEIALRNAGASQARLAREADIDQSSISRYLRGQCEPNLRQFRAIADALRVAPSFLLPDEGEPLRLVPSGEPRHYYVFEGEALAGEWRGSRTDVFKAAELVDEATGRQLLTKVTRKRGSSRAQEAVARRRGNGNGSGNGGRKRR